MEKQESETRESQNISNLDSTCIWKKKTHLLLSFLSQYAIILGENGKLLIFSSLTSSNNCNFYFVKVFAILDS